jgi:hypothetical protein
MKILLATLCYGLLLGSLKGNIAIDEVINNKNRNGQILLKQGYKGQLKVKVGEELVQHDFKKVFEFTHAILNDRGDLLEAPRAQGICVGIDVGPNKSSYRFTTIYADSLPDIDLVTSAGTMADLIKLLGTPRSTIPGDAKEGERIASSEWNLFTLNGDGSIDVISVFVISRMQKEQWIITDKRVAQGVFRPTAVKPILEKEAVHGDAG